MKIVDMATRREIPLDQAAVDKSGGGGDDGGMIQRIQALEAKVDRIGLDMAEVKGKVSQMPSTWQMVVLAVAIFAAIGAMGWALQARLGEINETLGFIKGALDL